MKNLIPVLAVMLILATTLSPLADYELPGLGLVGDDVNLLECHGDLESFVPLYLDMEIVEFAGFRNPVAATGFQVVNVPPDLNFPYGDTAFSWVVDNVNHDFATHVIDITFDPPLETPPDQLHLGRITLVPYNDHASWVGDDHVVSIDAAWVRDIYGQVYWASEGFFTLNCTVPANCGCFATGTPLYWLKAHAVSPAMNSDVTGTFDFGFTLESLDLLGGSSQPYSGEILVNSELMQTFAGVDVQEHSFQISTEGMVAGSAITVEVLVENDEHPYISTHLSVPYEIDDGVAAEEIPISRIKALY
ncbi:MAG: hypothetical protein GY835_12200 [bacterium]|nr:hypothetical protein [bacterium]